jgi:hypothetical protein
MISAQHASFGAQQRLAAKSELRDERRVVFKLELELLSSCHHLETNTRRPQGSRSMQRPWENPPVPLPPSSDLREKEREEDSSGDDADLPPPQVSCLAWLRGTGSDKATVKILRRLSRPRERADGLHRRAEEREPDEEARELQVLAWPDPAVRAATES